MYVAITGKDSQVFIYVFIYLLKLFIQGVCILAKILWYSIIQCIAKRCDIVNGIHCIYRFKYPQSNHIATLKINQINTAIWSFLKHKS